MITYKKYSMYIGMNIKTVSGGDNWIIMLNLTSYW